MSWWIRGNFYIYGGGGGWGTQLGSSGSFTAKRLRHSHLQEKGGSNLSRYLLIGLELIEKFENWTQILRRRKTSSSLSLKTACLRWHFSTFLVKASKKCHRNFCTFSASLQLVGPAKVKFNLKMKKNQESGYFTTRDVFQGITILYCNVTEAIYFWHFHSLVRIPLINNPGVWFDYVTCVLSGHMCLKRPSI